MARANDNDIAWDFDECEEQPKKAVPSQKSEPAKSSIKKEGGSKKPKAKMVSNKNVKDDEDDGLFDDLGD